MSDPVPDSVRRWRFDWRLLLFTGLFLPLLVFLGFWQLERAEDKQQQLAQWQQEAEQLNWPNHVAQGIEAGQPVTLSGQYKSTSWLLDNRTRDGVAGYEVLTLFQPDQGVTVVVNRGWVKGPRRRDELPDVVSSAERVVITGRLSDFPEPPVLKAGTSESAGWPRRVQSFSQENAQAESADVADLVLRLTGPEQPGAYRADWAPDRMGAQTHYGYAAQWFSLAVALVILTAIASYRRTGADQGNNNG